MSAGEFASSVWYHAGTLALDTPQASEVLKAWEQFARWDDELDEIFLGERPSGDSERVERELRCAADNLLARFANPP